MRSFKEIVLSYVVGANEEWEIDEIRKALIEARAIVEAKAYSIKQKQFKEQMMGGK